MDEEDYNRKFRRKKKECENGERGKMRAGPTGEMPIELEREKGTGNEKDGERERGEFGNDGLEEIVGAKCKTKLEKERESEFRGKEERERSERKREAKGIGSASEWG